MSIPVRVGATVPSARSVKITVGSDEARGNVLAEVVRDVIAHRELLMQLTRRDVTIRYKQAAMGFLWAILIPTIVVLAGVLVRFGIAVASGTKLPASEIAGIMVKALPWSFFVGSIGFAANSLLGNMNLVTKVAFPREVLPLSAVLAQAFDAVIASIAVLIAICAMRGGTLSAQLLWLPLMLLVFFTFTVAASFFLACANLFFRDVKYLVQVFLTFGIFFTPVFFDAATFGPKGRFLMLNPLAPMLEGIRLSVVQGHNLLAPLTVYTRTGAPVLAWSPWYLAYSILWAFGGLLLSVLIFHRAQDKFAEYI